MDIPDEKVVEEVKTPTGRFFIVPNEVRFVMIAQTPSRDPEAHIRSSVPLVALPGELRRMADVVEQSPLYLARRSAM